MHFLKRLIACLRSCWPGHADTAIDTLGQSEVIDEVASIRDLLDGDVLASLMSDSRRWNELCASLDTIEDTAMTLSSSRQLANTDDRGLQYLSIYGVLQALVVQQDAIKLLAKSVGLQLEFSDAMKHIRRVRNCAIGHPTKCGSAPKPGSYGIIQATMSADGFELYMFGQVDSFISEPVVIVDLIHDQRTDMLSELSKVHDVLRGGV